MMAWLLDVVRVLTSLTSLLMMLSPTPVIYRVLKTRSTGHSSIYPLVVTLVNTHAWMLYGYVSDNLFPIFLSYLMGEIVLLGYIAIYYRFTANRRYAHQLFTACGVAVLLISSYAAIAASGLTGQSPSSVNTTQGLTGIGCSLVMYSSPFEQTRRVLKHRSGVFIPIHMTLAACINNATWIVYALLSGLWILFVPNVFYLTMGLIQTAIYWRFHPSTHPYTAQNSSHDAMELPLDLEAPLCKSYQSVDADVVQ